MSEWPVVVINLNRSTDRWEKINKAFPKEKLLRSIGVDGREWEDDTLHNDGRPRFKEDKLSFLIERGYLKKESLNYYPWIPCEVGCAMSHIKVWEFVANGKDDWVIVLEDDAIPTNALTGTIQETIEDTIGIPDDADVIFLTGEDNKWGAVQIDSDNRLINGFGNTGYLISKEGARKAINAQMPMYYPCDIQWWAVAFKNLSMYVNVPNKVEKGYAYGLTEGIIDVDTENWTTTMTPYGSKPWKQLPYERTK